MNIEKMQGRTNKKQQKQRKSFIDIALLNI